MNVKPDFPADAARPDRVISNVPDGMQPIVLARQVEARLKADPAAPVSLVFVARDGRRL
jgi:transcription-repair coupling factor (superfamily II helicase)